MKQQPMICTLMVALLGGCASDPFGPESYSPGSDADPAAAQEPIITNTLDDSPPRYDASGEVRCATQTLQLDQQCAFRVVRGEAGSAEIWLAPVASDDAEDGVGGQRVLRFADNVFSSGDGVSLTWERQDDNWLVGVEAQAFYLLPDALIEGG